MSTTNSSFWVIFHCCWLQIRHQKDQRYHAVRYTHTTFFLSTPSFPQGFTTININLPALAIDKIPGPVCLKVKFSSSNLCPIYFSKVSPPRIIEGIIRRKVLPLCMIMIYISRLCCCRQFASPSQSSRQNCSRGTVEPYTSQWQYDNRPPRCVSIFYLLEECDGAIIPANQS